MTMYEEKPNPQYLTTNEVKDLLKCSLKTVFNFTKRGILKRYSLGGRRVYYLRSEVESAMFGID
jgi:predicted DNA-binding transcriptional regulator AlpA